jgi:hypothetical protein
MSFDITSMRIGGRWENRRVADEGVVQHARFVAAHVATAGLSKMPNFSIHCLIRQPSEFIFLYPQLLQTLAATRDLTATNLIKHSPFEMLVAIPPFGMFGGNWPGFSVGFPYNLKPRSI